VQKSLDERKKREHEHEWKKNKIPDPSPSTAPHTRKHRSKSIKIGRANPDQKRFKSKSRSKKAPLVLSKPSGDGKLQGLETQCLEVSRAIVGKHDLAGDPEDAMDGGPPSSTNARVGQG
jgi:hypothetical protein